MLPSKASCCLLVHLAILLGILLVQSCKGQSWAAFQNKHIDYPKTSAPNLNAYCNLMMVRRNLNPLMCKPINTFINSDTGPIQQVCGRGGTYQNNNFYDSIQSFSMVNCRNTGGTPPNNCRYNGKNKSLRIRVACRNNLPVHLEAVLP